MCHFGHGRPAVGIAALYPPSIGDCTPDYHYLPLQAEIWQYTPQSGVWAMVFQSPNSLTTTDNNGNTVATARDIGFRGLTVVTEPGGVQALYAGGVTSGEMFEPADAFGTWAPPRVLRSVDGVNWAPLPQGPGTFMGNLTANGTAQYPIYSIRSAAQLNGVLFLQVGDFPGVGRVIALTPVESGGRRQQLPVGQSAYRNASGLDSGELQQLHVRGHR